MPGSSPTGTGGGCGLGRQDDQNQGSAQACSVSKQSNGDKVENTNTTPPAGTALHSHGSPGVGGSNVPRGHARALDLVHSQHNEMIEASGTGMPESAPQLPELDAEHVAVGGHEVQPENCGARRQSEFSQSPLAHTETHTTAVTSLRQESEFSRPYTRETDLTVPSTSGSGSPYDKGKNSTARLQPVPQTKTQMLEAEQDEARERYEELGGRRAGAAEVLAASNGGGPPPATNSGCPPAKILSDDVRKKGSQHDMSPCNSGMAAAVGHLHPGACRRVVRRNRCQLCYVMYEADVFVRHSLDSNHPAGVAPGQDGYCILTTDL